MNAFLPGFGIELDWPVRIFGLPLLDSFISILVVSGVIIGFMSVFAGLATYAERKIAAHMQHRVGPYRVGPHGLLQWIADGIKLILKEDLIPKAADKLLFRTAPYLVMASAFIVWVALPYAQNWAPANFSIGILYILAVSGVGVVGVLMAGWSSGSKWSLFGAMRSAAQIVSYEVPTGLTILGMLLIAGTLNMQEIVEGQANGSFFGLFAAEGEGYDGYQGFYSWYVMRYPPFTILAFLVFYTAALAETNRTPFDIPEAESELVAGFHTEYSGMRFAFFFLAEYAAMFAISAVGTALFLGGWLSPFPNIQGLGIALLLGIVLAAMLFTKYKHLLPALVGFVIGTGVGATAALFIFGTRTPLALSEISPTFAFFEGIAWFVAKSSFLVFVMMWLRWTLPRYRVDQLMDLCWKKLTPLAFINLLALGLIELGVQALKGP